MPAPDTSQANLSWLMFAALAFSMWGMYGIALHAGVNGMDPTHSDPNARYKAYIFVGAAYFFAAICAPIIVLYFNGATWNFPGKGIGLSLFAGLLGAMGAFFVLSAMGSVAKKPSMIPVVMAVIFAGAPIITAIVTMILYPPAGGLGTVKWQFWCGILIAACGAAMVTLYKPPPTKHKPAKTGAAMSAPAHGDAAAVSATPPSTAGEDATP